MKFAFFLFFIGMLPNSELLFTPGFTLKGCYFFRISSCFMNHVLFVFS